VGCSCGRGAEVVPSYHPGWEDVDNMENTEKMENMDMLSGSPTEMFCGSPTEMFSGSPT